MRFVLALLLAFALAVAIALFAGNNQGVVTLFWPPHRLDVSVNLALLVLLAFVVAVHLALQSVGALLRLPAQAREWRGRQKEHAMVAALSQGISYFLAGRFVRARRAAADAMAIGGALNPKESRFMHDAHFDRLRALASWLAAESAHALQNTADRDGHAALALSAVQRSSGLATREGILLRQARWALDDRDPQAALGLLKALAPGVQRRTVALRMQLRAARSAGAAKQALEVARSLAKHGAFSGQVAEVLKRSLASDVLRTAHDTSQLQAAWHGLDAGERAMVGVACDAAERWMSLAGSAAQAREWLSPHWSQYGQLQQAQRVQLARALHLASKDLDSAWLARFEAAQTAQPADAVLQFLAGQACFELQLWGKAQTLLVRAAAGLTDTALRRTTALLMASMAEQRGDPQALATALRMAAQP